MTETDPTQPILEIENLSISFFTRAGEIPAVMDFSCTVMPGEAMGLVGESGCGKSTVALGVMNYLGKNGRIVGGSIKFKGRDLSTLSKEEWRDIRGSEIAMIYQEPMASLNPAMKIDAQLMEVPQIHGDASKEEARALAREMIEAVKLPDVKVFHAGTKEQDGQVVTAGGRVLNVTALGPTIAEAKLNAYTAVKRIRWSGAWCRKDISDKALG